LRSASGVAWFAGGDEFGVVSDEVVRDQVVCFCGGCFVAPVAHWIAL
jgi:hypothetical protein